VHFALVQDGLPWPPDDSIELIGRLPRSESLVLVGRNADDIKRVQDFGGKRIGMGPAGSGTEYVARLILTQFTGLDIKASTHPLVEQLAKVESGELDLAAMVIDTDAQLLVEAVRERNLQVVDMPSVEALANRLPFARAGRIEAGHYDPMRQLPSTDKRVIQVDTLVIGNGCGRESTTQGVITLLAYVFPDFVRVNRDRSNSPVCGWRRPRAVTTTMPTRSGRDYVPWIIDIIPTALASATRHLALVCAGPCAIVCPGVTHDASASKARVRACSSRGSRWPRLRNGAEDRHHEPVSARIDGLTAELGLLAGRQRSLSSWSRWVRKWTAIRVTDCGLRTRQDLPSPAQCRSFGEVGRNCPPGATCMAGSGQTATVSVN
jgi:hypothetical protein